MRTSIPLPTPRRSLRSLLVLLLLLLGPYIAVRHLSEYVVPSSFKSYTASPASVRSSSPWERESSEKLDYSHGEGLRNGRKLAVWTGSTEDGEELGAGDDRVRYGANDDSGDGRAQSSFQFEPSDLDPSTPQHTFLPNGLLIPNTAAPHPIYTLLKTSQRRWKEKLAKQSKTLAQAVDEYRRRYARDPPRGFERWWAYAERNGVQLKDEYDQIHRDLEPFHAFTPNKLQALVREASSKSGMYSISCPGITHTKLSKVKPGSNKAKLRRPSSKCVYKVVETGLNEEGRRVASERAEAQLELLEDIEDLLEEVKVVMYSHDVPWQFVGHEYKIILANVTLSQIDDAHLGWASACAPHKPLRETYDPDVLPDMDSLWAGDKSFVWDHQATMDPCIHPTLTHLVGFLSGHGKGPGPSKELYPVLAMCKTTLHADVLGVSMEAWTEDVGDDPAWEEKKDDRMLWRGKTTGIYFKNDVPWNISQRVNLVHQAAQISGYLPTFEVPSRESPETPVGHPIDLSLSQLNSELMDVGFVDEAIQCDEEICKKVEEGYKFAGRKDWNQGNQYKYLLDIDGNGWSARFKRLMSTNSVVLKSTIFPEWYTDRIQPWVHYIPIKADLTDLYDALSFFRGGNDGLAKEIAVAGKEWSKTFWRKEDMVAYQFR
ncbi:hypothetical protein I317_03916 [Kwoniella heveanensis CBS 569]|nr:hypothetical protein I317_03916 [Kwoniella heveanensis CBS 569]